MMYAAYKCDLRRMQPSVWETAYISCILQIQLNEGREMKAAFQRSFRLRWPSATFDDVAAEICSLRRMHPLIWEAPHVCLTCAEAKMKPKRFDRPLVASCSIGHKL